MARYVVEDPYLYINPKIPDNGNYSAIYPNGYPYTTTMSSFS